VHYSGKIFNATATGGVLKGIACERCGGGFFYQLVRAGVATDIAHYGLGQDSAAAQAQWRAEAALAAQLQVDCEAVPCPHCGHIQQAMIDSLRERMYRPLLVLSWVLPFLGLFITGFVALVKWANEIRAAQDYTLCMIAAAGWVGLLPLLLGIRRRLLARGKWLQLCVLKAPPALLPHGRADENGNIAFVAVSSQQSAPAPGLTHP
jgi:hypothetical protein